MMGSGGHWMSRHCAHCMSGISTADEACSLTECVLALAFSRANFTPIRTSRITPSNSATRSSNLELSSWVLDRWLGSSTSYTQSPVWYGGITYARWTAKLMEITNPSWVQRAQAGRFRSHYQGVSLPTTFTDRIRLLPFASMRLLESTFNLMLEQKQEREISRQLIQLRMHRFLDLRVMSTVLWNEYPWFIPFTMITVKRWLRLTFFGGTFFTFDGCCCRHLLLEGIHRIRD